MDIKNKRLVVREAVRRKMPVEEVVWALDVPRCDCCHAIQDKTIRKLVKEPVHAG